MELVAVNRLDMVLSRVAILMPYQVPQDVNCGLDEYKEAYLNKAAYLFSKHLTNNMYKNFSIYAVAQSKMNDVEDIE
jgi:hypothetical protein